MARKEAVDEVVLLFDRDLSRNLFEDGPSSDESVLEKRERRESVGTSLD